MRSPTSATPWHPSRLRTDPRFVCCRRSAAGNDDIEHLGSIDYLVVDWLADRPPAGSALLLLVDLVGRGIIRVLDLAFVRRELDGSVTGVDISDLGLAGEFDVTLFVEAASGLLGDDDLAEAGAVVEPGCWAAVLVCENTWAAPFAAVLRRTGAQLVANGRIPVRAVIATLDALDS